MVTRSVLTSDTPARSALDKIAAELVRVHETAKGGIITTPVLFPSGAHVSIRIVLEEGPCLITDDGVAYAEADMMGAVDIFKRSAKAVAEDAGIRFNSYEIFEAKTNLEYAPGIIAIVADAARRSIQLTSERLARRIEADTRSRMLDRLMDAFGTSNVETDAIISGSSTHHWTVDALVRTAAAPIAVQFITPAPVSVSSSFMKLDDIRRLDDAPRTVGALSARTAFKADQLLILGRAARLIDVRSPLDDYKRLAA